MNTLTITIRHVDGSLTPPRNEPESILHKLKALQDRGLEGKRLINELLTDDWAAPPQVVHISGVVDGKRVDISLHYD